MNSCKLSSSSSNTGSWPNCGHGIPATIQICRKKGPNEGRKFHGCQLWKDKKLSCGYFEWTDKGQPSSEDKKFAIERNVDDVIRENEKLKEDNERLRKKVLKEKIKKTTAKEELKNIKEELFCLKMRATGKWGWEKMMFYILLILVGIGLDRSL